MFEVHDRLHRLGGSFGLVRCSCGLVVLSPRPKLSELGFYYPAHEYYSYANPVSSVRHVRRRGIVAPIRDIIRSSVLASRGYPVQELPAWERPLRPVFIRLFSHPALYGMPDRIPRFRQSGSALDVGCGNGEYLSYLKYHGWNVCGVDVSHAAAQSAKSAFDIDVFVGNLVDAPFAPRSFDFVHLNHSFEHLPDPVETLRAVASLLKPDGELFIATPNARSFAAKATGSRWMHWDAPRHLFIFSPETLSEAMLQAGLEVSQTWSVSDPLAFHWEDTYLQEESGTRLEKRPSLRFTRRPRAILLKLERAFKRIADPLSGDFLCVRGRVAER